MTDGAWSYTHNRALADLLTQRDINHIVTPPYTPRWNGKVERFIQTLLKEWAYDRAYPNNAARLRRLPKIVDAYNRRRPHTALGGVPPISRVSTT